MEITGDKVVLRRAGEQDSGLLLSLAEDPEIIKVTGGYSRPASYDHQIQRFCSGFDAAGSLYCIIADKKKPQAGLEIIILSRTKLWGDGEIYIKLIPSARQKGYGQDAVAALVSYGFREWKLNHIYASILESNTPSRTLFEACGFQLEGLHQSTVHHDGRERTVCVYGLSACGPDMACL